MPRTTTANASRKRRDRKLSARTDTHHPDTPEPTPAAAAVRRLRERLEADAGAKNAEARAILVSALEHVERVYASFAARRAPEERFLAISSAPPAPGAEGHFRLASQVEGAPVDAPFVPTPPDVVELMLDLAGVTGTDVVYDLGSGDGRVVIAAARRGARAIGIERDPARIEGARLAARDAGVSESATFRSGDFFAADLRDATVVTLYQLQSTNLQLRKKLQSQLSPGSRIVSHAFDMGDWAPEKTAEHEGHRVYLWIAPKPARRPRRRASKREQS